VNLNSPNRRMRTRTSGGVAGVVGRRGRRPYANPHAPVEVRRSMNVSGVCCARMGEALFGESFGHAQGISAIIGACSHTAQPLRFTRGWSW
jgi:hypothetical protein